MAKSTIKSIFNGEVMLWEEVYRKNLERQKAEEKVDEEMKYLTRHMTSEDKRRFEEYTWLLLQQNYAEAIDAQVNAFVLGVHVGLELLEPHNKM